MTADLEKNSHKFLISLDDLKNIRVTGVRDFHLCPRMWKAKQLGEGVRRESPYARRGTAVHLTVERYLRGEPAVYAWFVEQRAFLASEGVPEEEVENTFRYLQTLKPLRDGVLQVEQRVSYTGYHYPLVGHVDAIFRFNDEGDLLILDHKSNRSYRSAAWWRQQPQQRLYAWLVRQAFRASGEPFRDVYFAIGYTNLDRRVVWRTDPADDAWCYQQYMNLIDELLVYRRTDEWPERVNPDCKYCPVKATCQTFERSQERLTPAAAATALQLYQWAVERREVFEAIIEDQRGQILALIAEIDGREIVEGGLRARAKVTQRRSIDHEGAIAALASLSYEDHREAVRRVFKPLLGELDKVGERHPAVAEEVATQAKVAEVTSLVVEEVGDE